MGLDLSKLRNENIRLETKGGGNFGDNFVKMPQGDYGVVTVRLLPSPGAVNDLYCVTRTHKINEKNIHCPMELVLGSNGQFKWQGNCPICNEYSALWKQSDRVAPDLAEQLQDRARAIKPQERYYYNCIVRKLQKPDGTTEVNAGPKILSVGKQLHSRIIRAIVGAPEVDEPELGDVTDFATGRDLKIIMRMTASGGRKFPSYNESKFNDVTPAGTKAEIDKWKGTLQDIMALRQLKPLEELVHEIQAYKGEAVDAPAGTQVYGDHPPVRAAVTVPGGVPHSPPRPTVKPAPLPADDIDTSLADDDFLSALNSVSE